MLKDTDIKRMFDSLDFVEIERFEALRERGVADYMAKVVSPEHGHRCTKVVTLADYEGMSYSNFTSLRHLYKRHLDVATAHCPEASFQIIMVNCPLAFRFAWSIAKYWLHPRTRARVQILGGKVASLAYMKSVGYPVESVPAWLGGSSEGTLIQEVVRESRERVQAAAVKAAATEDNGGAAALAGQSPPVVPP